MRCKYLFQQRKFGFGNAGITVQAFSERRKIVKALRRSGSVQHPFIATANCRADLVGSKCSASESAIGGVKIFVWSKPVFAEHKGAVHVEQKNGKLFKKVRHLSLSQQLRLQSF